MGVFRADREYSASFTTTYSRTPTGSVSPSGVLGPAIGAGALKTMSYVEPSSSGQTIRTTYFTHRVPFALRLRDGNSYYVTATFTGDQFLPRIIESNAAGERLGQIDPVLSDQELDACRAGQPAAPRVPKPASAEAGYRVSWRLRNDSAHTSCD